MPYHSILISAFNRFDYLENTLQSCFTSTDTDFEIIVSDDASQKENADIFYSQYLNYDKRLSIIRHNTNDGVGQRFQELHKKANGKLLHLIGSDDLMHPNRLHQARQIMNYQQDYSQIMYSNAYFLDCNYKMLPSHPSIISPIMQKAWLFLQPKVLHPTVSSWHPDLSRLDTYRSEMRAAVDYAYYVDNYFHSTFRSSVKKLTYLVHSSSGISRTSKSRSNQLHMHDIVMHRLWCHFVDCSLDEISTLRQLLVTPEYPMIPFESITKTNIKSLLAMSRQAELNLIFMINEQNSRFDFLNCSNDSDEYKRHVSEVFRLIYKRLKIIESKFDH